MKLTVHFYILQTIVNRVTLLATIVALFLSACTEDQAPLPITLQSIVAENLLEPSQAQKVIRIEADDLAENLKNYTGQRVSVRETIGETIGEGAFLLRDYHLFGSQTILVFNASGHAFTLPPEPVTDEVLVTGEVRQFEIAEFERDYGMELNPDRYTNYETLPAIMAQSIVLAPDPDEVTQNPDAFYDQVIAVAGEMDDRLAPNIFTLDEEQFIGGEDLLVIATTTIPSFEEDDEDIIAVGVLRLFDAATFEREYDLDWNAEVQQQIKTEFTNKPVLVAQAVYLAAD